MSKKIFMLLVIIVIISLISSCSSITKETEMAKEEEKNGEQSLENIAPAESAADTTFAEKLRGSDSIYIQGEMNTEEYSDIEENSYKLSLENPLSTFSIDVDTASYSNVRRFLMDGKMPPEDAVRIEEMINYFTYDYPEPHGDAPFSVITKISKCPWNENHDLAMLALKGKEIETEEKIPSNLVFLIDVSGSMNQEDKLPLLKSAFKMLVNQLDEEDRVSVVVYSGAAGVVLDSTSGSEKDTIIDAIENLRAGGSTAGGEGIELAYKIAKENSIDNGNNRVILATDGDFNVGPSSDGELKRLIEEKRKDGVFLSILGFGTGNLKDSKAELLANKGNGNYSYIDNILEAKKVLVDEIGSTLFTIAKDVKIQVEFNPSKVKAYRLIGYENRLLNDEDFNDDKKDAGEIGAGHTVTAFYELIPSDSDEEVPGTDELKYQDSKVKDSDDIMYVKLRYKEPQGEKSKLIEFPVIEKEETEKTLQDFNFASAVAEFGMLLRDSQFKGNSSYDRVIEQAEKNRGKDIEGYRVEFIKMVKLAKELAK
ncbi:vWA domain-containing protein [Maledivibacter halophilus]|uniref:Ca-activated chloride channel family protein n=1 Tax=Maledivibacter halophilus TaxID=36842 RepID=A0A1T5L4D7_9FIRM|nr:VWA domain-containing protein [Maledivibacter halophilus]SKC70794.1 Ca-activated chloride channel family protein [Maledivibacter halophilus]